MEMREELMHRTREVEQIVEKFLPEESGYQKTVLEAMNYSVRAGGKRLRPMLMQETYRLFGGKGEEIEPFMAAIEMIHTSSLIHDDLPCMDNDQLRRGMPTAWVKFGYDMAVLAGDALLIYAVETAAKAFAMTEHGERVGRAIGLLAVLAGAEEKQLKKAEEMASAIGLAFQIQDDILDVTSTEEQLGKPVLSDEKNHKTTYVTLKGIDQARSDVAEISERAVSLLHEIPGSNPFLENLIYMLINREN